jgi:hypothetical protein
MKTDPPKANKFGHYLDLLKWAGLFFIGKNPTFFKKRLASKFGISYITHMNKDILTNLHTVRSDLRQKLVALQEEMKTTKADIEAVDRMIERYQGQTSLSLIGQSKASGSNGDKPSTFGNMVVDVLRQHYPRSMREIEIRSMLIHSGYKPTAKNFSGALFAMLSNLLKQGRITKTGMGAYKALDSDVMGEDENK